MTTMALERFLTETGGALTVPGPTSGVSEWAPMRWLGLGMAGPPAMSRVFQGTSNPRANFVTRLGIVLGAACVAVLALPLAALGQTPPIEFTRLEIEALSAVVIDLGGGPTSAVAEALTVNNPPAPPEVITTNSTSPVNAPGFFATANGTPISFGCEQPAASVSASARGSASEGASKAAGKTTASASFTVLCPGGADAGKVTFQLQADTADALSFQSSSAGASSLAFSAFSFDAVFVVHSPIRLRLRLSDASLGGAIFEGSVTLQTLDPATGDPVDSPLRLPPAIGASVVLTLATGTYELVVEIAPELQANAPGRFAESASSTFGADLGSA